MKRNYRILVFLALLGSPGVSFSEEIAKSVELRPKPGGPPIAIWQRAANPKKPYVSQLFAPGRGSLPLLDDSPVDHIHHHGMMFAIGAGDSDFWNEKIKNPGKQEPVGHELFPAGNGFSQTLRWIDHNGNHLLDETRVVKVRIGVSEGETVHWLDWESTIRPAKGQESVKLWGRQYFGLGMRFLPEWKNNGHFLWQNSKGQISVRGDERLTPGGWCAAMKNTGGSPVTVLMLKHPDNSRTGAWFTMSKPFCYLSSTCDLEKHPTVLKPQDSWTFRHSVAVISRSVDERMLDRIADEWKTQLPSLFPIPSPQKP